jgi:transcriptional regulator with XRE-family HTH domain
VTGDVKARVRLNQRVVAANLRRLRQERGITQAEIGAALALSRSAVLFLESGRIRVRASQLPVLARLLGTTIEAFFVGADGAWLPMPEPGDTVADQRLRELLISYAAIEEDGLRRALSTMAQALAPVAKR